MQDLKENQCQACEGYGSAMSIDEAKEWSNKVPLWQLDEQGQIIWRRFEFKGFNKTMGFVNAVAWIANQQNHHPTLEVGYNYCQVSYETHALKGLSPNDFICAAKIDDLLNKG